MNTLEPEPERTISQSHFKKILKALTSIFSKLIGTKKINAQEKESTQSDNESTVNRTFELNDKMLREIMTSRKDTFTINIEDDIDSILDNLADVQYAKVPVYEKSIDNIIGILNVKDLIIEAKEVGFKSLDIRKILQRPYFIPETKKVNELFNSLDPKSDNIFILVDEYGGFEGIVTMEDLIYEIKGVTYDKCDLKHHKIKKIDDKNYMVKGFLTVSEFNEIFEANIEQGDYDTLNGYIINQLGQIPKPNSNEDIQLDLGKLMLKLIKINNRRIEDIQISILY